MISLILIAMLLGKTLALKHLAPATYERFVMAPRDWQWVASLLCIGQLIAGAILQNLQFPYSWGLCEQLIGGAVFVVGQVVHLAAVAVNPYFQPDIIRPPTICKHWLYRVLRHPGYLGLWLSSLGQTLAIGYAILAPCFFGYTALLLYRTIKEERLLCQRFNES